MVTIAPRLPRQTASPETAPRTISILGATGSIGTSTLDLLVRQRDRYRVEAVTAQRNVEALAKTAIALGARFAAVAEPDCLCGAQGCSVGIRHHGRGRRRRGDRGRIAAGRPDRGLDQRRRRTRADHGCDRARHGGRDRQQGMPGLRRCAVHAAGRGEEAPRSCRSIPNTMRCSRRWRPDGGRMSAGLS